MKNAIRQTKFFYPRDLTDQSQLVKAYITECIALCCPGLVLSILKQIRRLPDALSDTEVIMCAHRVLLPAVIHCRQQRQVHRKHIPDANLQALRQTAVGPYLRRIAANSAQLTQTEVATLLDVAWDRNDSAAFITR